MSNDKIKPETLLGIAVAGGLFALHFMRNRSYKDLFKFDWDSFEENQRRDHEWRKNWEIQQNNDQKRRDWIEQNRARLTKIQYKPRRGFADAKFEWLPGGFRQDRFRVSSEKAKASVTLGYDVADRVGGLSLVYDEGKRFHWPIWIGSNIGFMPRDSFDKHLKLAARILSSENVTPKFSFDAFAAEKTDSDQILKAEWEKYNQT